MPLSCAVNPECGRERKYGLTTAPRPKKVLVIGGGVAGMEAARVCALRGHKVTLEEKTGQLGGTLIPGGYASFKSNDCALYRWYERQLRKLGVAIKLNTEADESSFRKDFDTIVVATGSRPADLPFPADIPPLEATDVLLKRARPGKSVIIIGGGLVGCELGLQLAKEGHEVTIVEKMPEICGGEHAMPFMNYDMLKNLLSYQRVAVMTGTGVSGIDSQGVHIVGRGGEGTLKADTVVSAIGYKPYQPLQKAMESSAKECYNIGDSRQVQNIMAAIWEAYEVARSI